MLKSLFFFFFSVNDMFKPFTHFPLRGFWASFLILRDTHPLKSSPPPPSLLHKLQTFLSTCTGPWICFASFRLLPGSFSFLVASLVPSPAHVLDYVTAENWVVTKTSKFTSSVLDGSILFDLLLVAVWVFDQSSPSFGAFFFSLLSRSHIWHPSQFPGLFLSILLWFHILLNFLSFGVLPGSVLVSHSSVSLGNHIYFQKFKYHSPI